jgi:MFS family permease
MSTSDPSIHPTRARFILVLWLCGLSTILYLDRICMGKAVVPIQNELGLSNSEVGDVNAAFTLAYGLFAVPVGRWGDKVGPRIVLASIVLAWSVFTILTGLAYGLLALLVIRFLFGAAEAGAFPNAAKVIARWYPEGERGRVQGTMLAFAQIGAVAAPAGAAYLIEAVGWRWSFFAFGMIGILWAIGFWLWFRDSPADHRGVNAAELARIETGARSVETDPGPVPWRAVAVNRGVIFLSLIMVLGACFTYFFYFWFPKYLESARGVSNIRAGWLTSLVMAGSGVGMLVGGWLGDCIPRWSDDSVRLRRYLAMLCYFAAALCIYAGLRCDDPIDMAGFCCASFFAMHITLPNWWSVAIPQGGRHTATIFGLMNGLGVLGAMASVKLVGVFADAQAARGLSGRAQWDPILDGYVIVLILAGLAWWLYRFTPLPERAREEPS